MLLPEATELDRTGPNANFFRMLRSQNLIEKGEDDESDEDPDEAEIKRYQRLLGVKADGLDRELAASGMDYALNFKEDLPEDMQGATADAMQGLDDIENMFNGDEEGSEFDDDDLEDEEKDMEYGDIMGDEGSGDEEPRPASPTSQGDEDETESNEEDQEEEEEDPRAVGTVSYISRADAYGVQGSGQKYIPPALKLKMLGTSEASVAVRRKARGLMNRSQVVEVLDLTLW